MGQLESECSWTGDLQYRRLLLVQLLTFRCRYRYLLELARDSRGLSSVFGCLSRILGSSVNNNNFQHSDNLFMKQTVATDALIEKK
jgi:F0F1-type ATP synthase assembly protein I